MDREVEGKEERWGNGTVPGLPTRSPLGGSVVLTNWQGCECFLSPAFLLKWLWQCP